MGIYLNTPASYTLYKAETEKPYFVDKSMLLRELFPLAREGNQHICITRPRRFGKTIMANMIAAFFGKAEDAHSIFDRLKISSLPEYGQFINQYQVIHINFSMLPDGCQTYEQYISRIKRGLFRDIGMATASYINLEQKRECF